MVSLAVIMMASSANAGLFDFLGLGKKEAEPQTLSEACNKDDLSKFCPEVLLGTKTIPTCLTDNIKSLSKKCSKFVKNAVKEQAVSVTETVATAKTETTDSAKAKVTQVAEQKAAAKAAAKDIKDTAKQVGADAKETGALIKGMF